MGYSKADRDRRCGARSVPQYKVEQQPVLERWLGIFQEEKALIGKESRTTMTPGDWSETQVPDVHAAFGSAKGTNIDKTLHTMGTFLQKRPSHTYDSHGPQIAWCTDLMLPCGDWRGSRFGSKKAEIVEEGGIMSQLYP